MNAPDVATKESTTGPTSPETVAAWRREVLDRVFSYMFFLLAVILLVETSLSLRTGQWHALPALAVGVLLQGIAAFASRLGVRTRAGIFTIAAAVGMAFGLPVLGFALPIPFIVAAMTLALLALCVSQRFAFVALVALTGIVLIDGYYVCFIRAQPLPVVIEETQGVLDPNRFGNWLRVVSIFAGVGVAIIGSVGYLVRRLEDAVHHNGRLFGSLERESREKIRALEEKGVLEGKVRQAGELQLLGLLSATVAHDFNNLLMVILGNAAGLKHELHGQAKEDVADIERAGEQAADLCRRLLTLAGERISGSEVLELNAFVEAELPLLRRLVTVRVAVEWAPGPPLWFKCARTEMRQALLNLCANARDAMPRGGKLRIATERVERSRPEQTSTAGFARLVIADEGTGMDPATRARLFEPFFTTKAKGKGTGLGMAVVAAAMEAHAGFVELDTALGKGTTFSLFFPLVSAPAPSVAQRAESPAPASAHGETILVVDDDEGARRMLTRYLQKHGYTTLAAADGQEALELLSNTTKVALVVSDAVMPRLGGRALFDTVSKDQPELPFLFCSAFSAGTLPPEVFEAPHRAVLAKPFSEEALLKKVRALLDAHP